MDLRIQRSRQNLWRGFYYLMTVEKDLFSSITVNQICETALVHRSTFYKHFTDKYALLDYGLALLFADYEELSNQAKTLSPFYWANAFFENSQAQLLLETQQKDDIFDRLLRDYAIKMMKEAAKEYLATLPETTLPQDLMAEFIVGTVFTLSHWQNKQKTPISVKEMDAYFQHLINRELFNPEDNFDTDD